MDLSRMSQGEKLAVAGGVLLLIALFLPWFSDFSGWESLTATDIYLLITAGVAIGAAFAPGHDTAIPGVSRDGAAALLGLTSLVVLLWLLIFDWPEGADRGIGLILAIVATGLIAYGGYTARR
jgi:hypothetical protein